MGRPGGVAAFLGEDDEAGRRFEGLGLATGPETLLLPGSVGSMPGHVILAAASSARQATRYGGPFTREAGGHARPNGPGADYEHAAPHDPPHPGPSTCSTRSLALTGHL